MVWVQIFKIIIVVSIAVIICAYSGNLQLNQVMKKNQPDQNQLH